MVTLVTPTDSPKVFGPPQGRWTLADWETLPDDGNRYEIIDGVLYMSTAPSFFHQWISQQLYDLIGYPAKQQGVAIPVFAPIGVIMPGCDPIQPDFVIVLKEHAGIIRDRRIFGVPDLIVEILSPGNRDFDEDIKFQAYANAGVPEYAIIDPAPRAIRLFSLQAVGRFGLPQEFTGDQMVSFTCLPGITFRVSQLFEGAPDTTL